MPCFLLLVAGATVAACDGPQDCPAIDGSGESVPPQDHPKYAAAAASLTFRAPALETIDPSATDGDVQIRVDEVEWIDLWTSYECGGEDTVEITGASVLVEISSPDQTWSALVPATVADADTDAPVLTFASWSSTDPDVLARIPDTDLADDAEVAMLELEVTETDTALYRTDITSCTMLEGCSNTARHLLLRWSQDATTTPS